MRWQKDARRPRNASRLLRALAYRKPAPAARPANPLSVVQISGVDKFGVQVNGYLLHEYLRGLGHTSRMLVHGKYSQDPDVAEEIHEASGRPTMLDDGLKKVRASLTSLDELLRVVVS